MYSKKIAEYLKEEMNHQHLTCKELADRCELAEITIRQLRSNPGSTIKLETCEQLAKGLGKSLRVFLEEAGIIDLLGLNQVSSEDANIIIDFLVPFSTKYNLNIIGLDRNEKIELVNHIINSIQLIRKK